MNPSIKIGALSVAAAMMVSGQAGSQPSDPQSPPQRPATSSDNPSGIVVYIDPQTGAVRPDPASGTVPLQLTPQDTNAASTSHEGLVETPSPVPGGGVALDLQGRFQSPLIGTIDADGRARVQHLPALPKIDGSK